MIKVSKYILKIKTPIRKPEPYPFTKEYDSRFGRPWVPGQLRKRLSPKLSNSMAKEEPSVITSISGIYLRQSSPAIYESMADRYKMRYPEARLLGATFFSEFALRPYHQRSLLELLASLPFHGVGIEVVQIVKKPTETTEVVDFQLNAKLSEKFSFHNTKSFDISNETGKKVNSETLNKYKKNSLSIVNSYRNLMLLFNGAVLQDSDISSCIAQIPGGPEVPLSIVNYKDSSESLNINTSQDIDCKSILKSNDLISICECFSNKARKLLLSSFNSIYSKEFNNEVTTNDNKLLEEISLTKFSRKIKKTKNPNIKINNSTNECDNLNEEPKLKKLTEEINQQTKRSKLRYLITAVEYTSLPFRGCVRALPIIDGKQVTDREIYLEGESVGWSSVISFDKLIAEYQYLS